jgi:hypothetical protein
MILAAVFVYTAYKTRTLIAGIVFHFLHDALLYLVQVPGGEYIGFGENLAFFLALWLMAGVACLLSGKVLGNACHRWSWQIILCCLYCSFFWQTIQGSDYAILLLYLSSFGKFKWKNPDNVRKSPCSVT